MVAKKSRPSTDHPIEISTSGMQLSFWLVDFFMVKTYIQVYLGEISLYAQKVLDLGIESFKYFSIQFETF